MSQIPEQAPSFTYSGLAAFSSLPHDVTSTSSAWKNHPFAQLPNSLSMMTLTFAEEGPWCSTYWTGITHPKENRSELVVFFSSGVRS